MHFLFCLCIHIHRPRLLFRPLFFPAPMYNFGYLCKIIEFWLYIPIWGTFGSSTIFTNLAYFHVMNIFSWNYFPQNHQKSDNFQKVGQFWNFQSLIFLNSFEKFEFFFCNFSQFNCKSTEKVIKMSSLKKMSIKSLKHHQNSNFLRNLKK